MSYLKVPLTLSQMNKALNNENVSPVSGSELSILKSQDVAIPRVVTPIHPPLHVQINHHPDPTDCNQEHFHFPLSIYWFSLFISQETLNYALQQIFKTVCPNITKAYILVLRVYSGTRQLSMVPFSCELLSSPVYVLSQGHSVSSLDWAENRLKEKLRKLVSWILIWRPWDFSLQSLSCATGAQKHTHNM